MPSIIEGYEYDVFISYRQKDNKADKWVSHFVEVLKDEIEATFKEDISVYFDENPHDGLLETHDVEQSLQEKIKVLVFIPIISQTYCDPSSFAWQKEFIAFRDFVKEDEIGLDIRLANGNVCKRILPVRIHEIDAADQELYEKETGGVMRPVDFIYHTSGVNRPLTPEDDQVRVKDQILYRDQINKVANGVKEIINALKSSDVGQDIVQIEAVKKTPHSKSKISVKAISITSILALLLAITTIWYFKFYNQPQVLSEASRNARIAITPFTNNTNDPELDMLGDMASEWITRGLMNFDHIKVVSPETIRANSEFAQLKDSNMRAEFRDRTDANKVIKGSFYLNGDDIIFQIQVINLTTNEVELALPPIIGQKSNLEDLVIDLNLRIMTIFGLHDFTSYILIEAPPKYDSYKMYSKGWDYWFIDYPKSHYYFSEAIRLDSSFLHAYIGVLYTYINTRDRLKADSIIDFINHKFTRPTPMEQVMLNYINAKTNWDRYNLMKIWFKKDPKNLQINFQMGLDASKINKPNEVISICQNLAIENISFKNPAFARAWFYRYSYNLIRLNRLDEALRVLEVVPQEYMKELYYQKALIYVLKNQPEKIHEMIAEMKASEVDRNIIIDTYLFTSSWYALQGDYTSKREWAELALKKINFESSAVEINKYVFPWAYYNSEEYEQAIPLIQSLIETRRYYLADMSWLGICYVKLDSIDKANEIIAELDGINTRASKYNIATIYAALDEKELAVKYLEDAFESDFSFLFGRYDMDEDFQPLHGYPDYEKLVEPDG